MPRTRIKQAAPTLHAALAERCQQAREGGRRGPLAPPRADQIDAFDVHTGTGPVGP